MHIFMEARRGAPAILFLPHLQLWWATAPHALRATLWMLLSDLPAGSPIALVGTCDSPAAGVQQEDTLHVCSFGLSKAVLCGECGWWHMEMRRSLQCAMHA